MSALLKQPANKHLSSSKGFSLLEMLTVLFIIGAAAALVMPNLPLMLDRLSFAAERDTLVRDINALPYSALRANQDLVLSTDILGDGLDSDDTSLNSQFVSFSSPNSDTLSLHLSPSVKRAALNLPDEWKLLVKNPIVYKSSGFCSGGDISVIAGRLQYDFKLSAPYCQINEPT